MGILRLVRIVAPRIAFAEGQADSLPLATPVTHILGIRIKRSETLTALPRRLVDAGVQQIAGNVDLLALGGVGKALRRRLGMGLVGHNDATRRTVSTPPHGDGSWELLESGMCLRG